MSLFFPDQSSKKTYVEQYPELAEHQCFKELKGNEAMFVWLYASKESPFKDEQGVDKIEKAFDLAFKGKEDYDTKNRYLKNKFPEHVRAACEKMGEFDPSVRSRALETAKKMFANMVAIGSLDISDLVNHKDEDTGEVTVGWDDMSKYMTTLQKVREEMPFMIKLLEENMGFNMKVKGQVESGKSIHQVVMERKRLNPNA